MASAGSQPKFEKKLMDEKISKVREVVKNVSTNDIVLALHNFELDVEKTIHAFCEGGSQIALGDWEKTGTVKKRNNKKKPKSAKGAGMSDGRSTGEMTKEAPYVTSSISSIPSPANSTGFTTPISQPPQQNLLNGESAEVMENSKQQHTTIPLSSIVNAKNAAIQNCFVPPQRDMTSISFMSDAQQLQTKKLASENFEANSATHLTGGTYSNYLDENKTLFENEVTYARENIQRCLKQARDAISLREQELISELSQCHRDGIAYFASRTEAIKQIAKIKNVKLAAELEKRNAAAKIVDLETALATRFLYDTNAFTSLIESLNQFGCVIPVKTTENINDNNNKFEEQRDGVNDNKNVNSVVSSVQQVVRRSNSPSSLVSSIDSGLGGQISPVNQEKGRIAHVEENGIVLKSDSIAPDQLAEIQRNIFESLKAKGIDPALLTDINSNGIVAPRRRQLINSGDSANCGNAVNGNVSKQRPRGNIGNTSNPSKKQQTKAVFSKQT
uniref:CUE domain-containing protein n=1 Tax=Meloidogyne hapla TaxID=6305 RepID=A0A1I8C0I9_MELHA